MIQVGLEELLYLKSTNFLIETALPPSTPKHIDPIALIAARTFHFNLKVTWTL